MCLQNVRWLTSPCCGPWTGELLSYLVSPNVVKICDISLPVLVTMCVHVSGLWTGAARLTTCWGTATARPWWSTSPGTVLYCTGLYCTVLCASPGPSWTRTPGTRRRGAGSARSLKYNVLKIIKIYSVTCRLEEGIKCNIYPIKEKTKERQCIVISLVNE